MDYNAINTLISKAFYKGGKILLGSAENGTVGVTVDGFVMWFIPEKEFLFDKNKIMNDGRSLDIKSLTKSDGYTDAVRTNLTVCHDKKTLVIFKKDDIEVYVDLKLLKVFDPRVSSYKVKNNVSAVQVYEGDRLVGVVMPTRPPKI